MIANLHVGNIKPCIANMMRHALFADVTVQAVDTVTFLQYNGPIESCIVAHRFGQLPIKGDGDIEFQLCMHASIDTPLTWAMSGDIIGAEGRLTDNQFLMVPLMAGQVVHVKCKTRAGTGREHTRWNSVFPAMQKQDDGTYMFIIETTGAIEPLLAWESAKNATLDLMDRLLSSIF